MKLFQTKCLNLFILNVYCRYSEGQNAVSASKLPDEGTELCALRTIQRNEDEVGSIQFELECHSVDKETHHEDPIKWFGILVPQSLRTARENFEKSIELAIESANIEQRLVKNCENYAKLKAIKAEFDNVEE